MLWTFMIDRRISLTTNLAERNLRPDVIWQKLSHASHSRRGDEFRARVMSVVMTGRNLGMYLSTAWLLALRCSAALSLSGEPHSTVG